MDFSDLLSKAEQQEITARTLSHQNHRNSLPCPRRNICQTISAAEDLWKKLHKQGLRSEQGKSFLLKNAGKVKYLFNLLSNRIFTLSTENSRGASVLHRLIKGFITIHRLQFFSESKEESKFRQTLSLPIKHTVIILIMFLQQTLVGMGTTSPQYRNFIKDDNYITQLIY